MLDVAPYGSWPSPIPAELLVAGVAKPQEAFAAGGCTWWSESRPGEGGRSQLVRRDADGTVTDLLPEGGNARTQVHEYGGAAWWVHHGTVFYADWSDQRLRRLDPGGEPVVLTPEPPAPRALRYADGRVTPDGATVVCVRERHDGEQVRNEVVALPATGGEPVALVTGPDFVAAPRLSPDGRRLAWLEWDHPDMPWDATRLLVADLVTGDDGRPALAGARRVAGGGEESLVQPEWGPDGSLLVVSDRTGWWNVHRVDGPDRLTNLHAVEAEVGRPAWVFGQSGYAVAADGTVWMTYSTADGARLVGVAPGGPLTTLTTPYLALGSLSWDAGRLVALAFSAVHEPVVVAVDVRATDPGEAHADVAVLRPARDLGLDPAGISRPRPVDFPSAGGRTAHAWFYPPASATTAAPEGELPPLSVRIHGGPTAAADPSFRLDVQFWTSRGFAVVDVDYGGSTGYGRRYRRLLDGAWGVVDVDDACAAAAWLAEQGLVDGERLTIRGGSAGGYTVLACLATRDVFAAGASLYGVADLGALAADTHKFESRYLDRLVGPWPQAEAVYRERSPLTHIDGFDRPLIVLQGLEDEVVPPAQAEAIVAALAAKGVPHAYVPFPGEQHGFRMAATIVRALTAELSFYAQVFGFTPADDVEPVEVAFADRLPTAVDR